MSLPNLPESKDEEFWGDAEKHQNIRIPIDVCQTHSKERFMEHVGYRDNHDGSVGCKFCGWGSFIPGYYKVLNDRLVDLRELSGK